MQLCRQDERWWVFGGRWHGLVSVSGRREACAGTRRSRAGARPRDATGLDDHSSRQSSSCRISRFRIRLQHDMHRLHYSFTCALHKCRVQRGAIFTGARVGAEGIYSLIIHLSPETGPLCPFCFSLVLSCVTVFRTRPGAPHHVVSLFFSAFSFTVGSRHVMSVSAPALTRRRVPTSLRRHIL